VAFPKFDLPTAAQSGRSTVTPLDRSDASTTEALYRAALGTVNIDFYLPIFLRFDATKRSGLSWNGAASQYTLNWLVFRRLWRAALFYIAAVSAALLAAYGIDRLLFHFSQPVEIGLAAALTILYFVVPGLYGNTLLYNTSRKKMAHALATSKSLPEACSTLNQNASSRERFIRLLLANVALLGVVAAGYTALQASNSPLTGQQISAWMHNLAENPTKNAAPLPASAGSATAPMTYTASSPQLLQAAVGEDTAITTSTVSTSQSVMPAAEHPLKSALEPNPVKTTVKGTASPPKGSASAPLKHFYINVGLFANRENAHNARRKLLKEGLPAVTKELNTKDGLRTRVRVGPFKTRSETEAAVVKIHDLGLEAIAIQR
jgi:cell division septation protein DedD